MEEPPLRMTFPGLSLPGVSVLILTVISVSACNTTPFISSEQRLQAEDEIVLIYECVRYHEFTDNKTRSSRLINVAVKTGESSGIKGTAQFGLYDRAKTRQTERVQARAIDIARQRKPLVENIMDNMPEKPPTSADNQAALLELYEEQCKAMGAN